MSCVGDGGGAAFAARFWFWFRFRPRLLLSGPWGALHHEKGRGRVVCAPKPPNFGERGGERERK